MSFFTVHSAIGKINTICAKNIGWTDLAGSGFLIENAEQRSKRYKQQREEMLKLQEQNKEKDKKT